MRVLWTFRSNEFTCHNIKLDLREIEWDDMNCIHLVQDEDQMRAFVNIVLKLRVA